MWKGFQKSQIPQKESTHFKYFKMYTFTYNIKDYILMHVHILLLNCCIEAYTHIFDVTIAAAAFKCLQDVTS